MKLKELLKRTVMCSIISLGVSCGLVTAPCGAAPVEYTTGDLGYNVIADAGEFTLQPSLLAPSPVSPAEMDVKYGHWNSPDVLVEVFVNTTLVGNFTADPSNAYILPGPAFATFDVTGLLLNGVNDVKFTGNQVNSGDYVIGQAWIRYDAIPEPGTLTACCVLAFTLAIGRAWRHTIRMKKGSERLCRQPCGRPLCGRYRFK